MNQAVVSTPAPHTRARSSLLLTGLALGYFIVLLDTTIVTVALPAIRLNLGGGLHGLTWVANAYTMVYASLLLGMGSLSDRYGAKRVFLAGLTAFALASVLSAAASSLGMLIALRAILGIGGAAILPAALTIIAQTFTDPQQRARALGISAAVSGLALAAGPVLGGFLVDAFGWPSIFLVNVPVAIGAFVLVSRNRLDPARRGSGGGFDLAGQLTSILAVAALTCGIMEGAQWGWSSVPTIAMLAGGAALLLLFARIERRNASPMLPFSLFLSPAVSGGMAAGFLVNFGFSAALFLLTLYFQNELGHSARTTGLDFLAMTLPMAIVPMYMGSIVKRFGAWRSIGAGFLLAAAGLAILAFTPENPGYAVTIPALCMFGCGLALVLPALMSSVIAAAPQGTAGIASGALNAFRQLGATMGVAFCGVLLDANAVFADGWVRTLGVTSLLFVAGAGVAYRYLRPRG